MTSQLPIVIDQDSSVSIGQQLYDSLRHLVIAGKVQAGEKLPSSRGLAEQLGVSRPTVSDCYDQLISEGYLEARHGSGTYVATVKPEIALGKIKSKKSEDISRYPISSFAARFAQRAPSTAAALLHEIAFLPWLPAVDQFPHATWSKLLAKHTRSVEATAAASQTFRTSFEPRGIQALREAIAKMVLRFRDIQCSPEQVVLTMGLNHALDLVSRLHLGTGATAAVEDPGYPFAAEIIRATGASVLSLGVDEDGLDIQSLGVNSRRQPLLVYVTPAHQFPTGVVMSLKRRLELLEYAAQSKAILFEDDFDSEFRYKGRPIPALKSLDRQGRVIYAGTFNQTVLPSLGLGYLIVPEELVLVYRRARALLAEPFPLALQLTLTQFIEDGDFDRHVKKLRILYGQRRQCLIENLQKYFGERVELSGDQSGVYIVARFQTKKSDEQVSSEAAELGVGLLPVSTFSSERIGSGAFVMGFANLEEELIEEGVRRLATVLLA